MSRPFPCAAAARPLAVLLLSSAAAVPLHAAELVGEWNLDADACAQARIAYTADGRHESLQKGDAGWTTSASGSYRVEGDTVVVEFQGQSETLEIVRLDADTLVLRNADAARRSESGVENVRFVRCPAR